MIRVGIVGATGYTGEELLSYLAGHQKIRVAFVTSERQSGAAVTQVFPQLVQFDDLKFCTAEESTRIDVDVVFICLHAGESVKWAKRFMEAGSRVIDLGSDFRFRSPDVYEQWYHMPHLHPELLDSAVYGLTEWYRDDIKNASVVGNPGCYPTSVLLPLLPLIRNGLLAAAPIVVDSKSGVSGAGKMASETTHYVSVNENISPYKVGRVHRHVGEMEKEIQRWGGSQHVIFTPHLVPLTRGMLSTMYVERSAASTDDLWQALNAAYRNEPFVHVMQSGLPHIKLAQHSNFCFIGLQDVPQTDRTVLVSVIDNLGKGASTQALQNMNVMLGWDETTALL